MKWMISALVVGWMPCVFGAAIPYRVLVQTEGARLVEVDMDTGEQTAHAVPRPDLLHVANIAGTSDGRVFTIPFTDALDEELGPRYQGELDLRTGEWTLTDITGSIVIAQPTDLAYTPRGNLILADVIGIREWNPETLEFTRSFDGWPNWPTDVAVDGRNRVISHLPKTVEGGYLEYYLARQIPGTDEFEPLQHDITLGEFVVETDQLERETRLTNLTHCARAD